MGAAWSEPLYEHLPGSPRPPPPGSRHSRLAAAPLSPAVGCRPFRSASALFVVAADVQSMALTSPLAFPPHPSTTPGAIEHPNYQSITA